MQLTQETADFCSILRVEGRLDTATYGTLDAKLAEMMSGGASKILLDCQNLEYVSSSGLRVLLTVLKKMTASNGTFVLCGLQDNILEIFEISGFTGLFPIYPGRDDARAAF